MALVDAHGVAVHADGLLEVLVRDVLVAAERVRVREARVHRDGALEAADGAVVLLLEAEAVAGRAPGLGAPRVEVDAVPREVAQLDVVLEVPERRGQELEARHAVGLDAPHGPQAPHGRLVVRGLEVDLADVVLHLCGNRPPVRDVPTKLSSSVKSKSIRLIFGRIDCSHRVLEAQPKSLRQDIRSRAH